MKLKSPCKLIVLLLPFLFIACTPHYNFKIDAISDGAISNKGSFYMVSGSADLRENELRFQEASSYVATALEGKGYHKAKDLASADMLVELSFSMGEPRESVSVSHHPETYWQPGYSFSVQVPVYNKSGVVIGFRQRIVSRPPRSRTYWDEQLNTHTVFEKELVLSAYDNRLGAAVKEPKQLWSVIVTNEDGSDDLRSYIPYMIAAALPYIGEDTESALYTSIAQDDEKVDFIRNPDI